MIYRFAFHDRVPDDPPEHFMFDLYRRLKAGAKLDRKDKDILANSLYGTFGPSSATYKVMGWDGLFVFKMSCKSILYSIHGIMVYGLSFGHQTKLLLEKPLNIKVKSRS